MALSVTAGNTNKYFEWISENKIFIPIIFAVIIGIILILCCIPKCRQSMNKHREPMVILLTVLSFGICFAVFIYPWQFLKKEEIQAPMFVFIISALPSFYLWRIRNKDRLDAIEEQRKSNEEAEQSNKNARQSIQKAQDANDYTSFSHALTLLTDKDKVQTRSLGLQLLVQIKNKRGLFDDKIDKATQGINLRNANLKDANLQYTELQRAELEGAYLANVKLQCANLIGANLKSTNLQNANLQNAKLGNEFILTDIVRKEINFSGAKNLLKVNWIFTKGIESAIFDDEKTKQAVLNLKAQQEFKITAPQKRGSITKEHGHGIEY